MVTPNVWDPSGAKSGGSGAGKVIKAVAGAASSIGMGIASKRSASRQHDLEKDLITHKGVVAESLVRTQESEKRRTSENQFEHAKGWADHIGGKGVIDSIEAPGGFKARLSQPDTDVSGEVKASDTQVSAGGRTRHRTGRTEAQPRYAVRPSRKGGPGESGLTAKSVAAAKKAAKKAQK